MKLQVHLPSWITNWFPAAVWTVPNSGKDIYLTFDDGPIPEVTPRVLQLLREENVPATFFCVGENVFKYPEVFSQVLEDGHMVGNHTYNHVQGLKMGNRKYYENVDKANRLIGSNLFRPPHGWLRRAQYKSLSRRYKIVMWDVISCDYNPAVSPKECLRNVLKYVRPGSIITFHDSIKAENNLFETLPKVIHILKAQGYEFRKIEFEKVRNIYTNTNFGKLVKFRDELIQKWA